MSKVVIRVVNRFVLAVVYLGGFFVCRVSVVKKVRMQNRKGESRTGSQKRRDVTSHKECATGKCKYSQRQSEGRQDRVWLQFSTKIGLTRQVRRCGPKMTSAPCLPASTKIKIDLFLWAGSTRCAPSGSTSGLGARCLVWVGNRRNEGQKE